MKRYLFAIIISVLALASCKKDVYYSLNVAASPTEGGTVSPSEGSFLAGETVSIKATPSAEYLFEGWSGDAVGSSNPLSVVMDSDKSIVANFIKKSYSLAIEVEGCGHVEEKLLYTKSGYESGSSVELTAIPDEYWTFDHWEGDLSGNDNPKTIDVTSASSVKAVFVKPQYSFNVKIVGPGVVDEYLVETKSGLEAGTQVLLKAIPSEGAVFKGWSGDMHGNEPEVGIYLDGEKEITATFDVQSRTYDIPELNVPSVLLKRFYPDTFKDKLTDFAGNIVTLDYNKDGYPDLITSFETGEMLSPIRFYLGTEDGGLVPDSKNDKKITGLDECRKIIYGEYNGDGIVDICIISHGYDAIPFPGDYPLILLSDSEGVYHDVRFPDYVGFYHGGTAGDFDNDGDTDIFFSDSMNEDSVFLINDGKGNFTPKREIVPNTESAYTAELFDIDKDGYLDLIMSWPIRVIWGDGQSFATENISYLPLPENGSNGHLDFAFYDLDGDGFEEIIASSTKEYEEWEIQVIDYKGGVFKDVTKDYFIAGDYFRPNDGTLTWINIESFEGRTYLVGRMDGHEKQTRLMFEFVGGKFIPYEYDDSVKRYRDGLSLYHDYVKRLSYPYENVDFECSEDLMSGRTCIKIYDWRLYTGFNIEIGSSLLNGNDLSYLRDNGYVLEFYIKNTNPSLQIHFKFNSIVEPEDATYCYVYDGHDHECDGNWERVTIPLKDFDAWDTREDFWKKINHFNVIVCSEGGADFYLDEIRIRKIVDLE